jgi:hypothetical protein
MEELKIKKLKEELNFATVFSFFVKYGLDFLNSESFVEAVYQKANDDVNFWLTNAPHNLNGGRDDN